jgi:lysophospholipase L1-like esterase
VIKRIAVGIVVLIAVAVLGGYLWLQERTQNIVRDDYFEDAIAAFEAADRATPPPRDGILFTGSSSIRFWKTLARDMGELPVINRGFGGSQMNHLIYNAHRIITPYAPRIVVIYEGDNDLKKGSEKTPERVLSDYRALVKLIHESKSDVLVYFLAIKPSKRRWEQWPEMKRANSLIKAETETDPRLGYIDTASALLEPAGTLRDDVFISDGLHMNAAGYAAWTEVVRPVIESAYRR